MMNKDQWKPSDGIVLEANAKEAIITNDNILVQAGPGAEKTELLDQKASYLFQTGSCPAPFNILAISFKRDAAENIKERVSKRVGKKEGSRFTSKTFDAACLCMSSSSINALTIFVSLEVCAKTLNSI